MTPSLPSSATPDCTLLLCSCDAYEDTWSPFFTLLHCQWPQLTLPVVINTEHKACSFPGLNVCAVNQRGPVAMPWSLRLIECLERIDTEYVLLMLDDFFLCQPVDDSRFYQCLDWMRQNPNVASFCFYSIPDKKNEPDGQFPGFVKRPQRGEYRYNCQASLWRTKQLASFLRPHESPWIWETVGNWRSWRTKMDFYCAASTSTPIFDYYGTGSWSGVMRGRWYLPYVQPLFEQYGIQVDFTKRGTIDDDEVGEILRQKDQQFTYVFRKIYGAVLGILKNPKSLF